MLAAGRGERGATMSERPYTGGTTRALLVAGLCSLFASDAVAGTTSSNFTSSAQSLLTRTPLGLLAQAGPSSAVLDIPPVVDRPLGMDEGPRVVVSRFELEGAVDREKQGISVSELNVILNGHVNSQPPGGLTINQLQSIADEITRFYRERGLILAQAIVPAQEVTDGTVRLQVLEGSLEDVVVEGNRIYRASVVQAPFRRLQGQPVTQDAIERALLDVQDFPGLTVFGTLTQGEELGSTDLVVRVRDEDRAYITPSVDNYGSRFTGEYRATIDFKFNNVFGVADQISGYILQTFEPDNGTYGGLDFRVPIGRNAFGIGASSNVFDVGGLEAVSLVGVSGTAQQAYMYLNRAFANGRFFGSNGKLALAVKKADTEVPGRVLNEDLLTVLTLDWNFFKAGRGGKGFTIAGLAVDLGLADTLGSMDENGNSFSSRRARNGDYAGGDFTKVRFNLQHLRRLTRTNSLLFRVDGQYSSDLLVALEQYSIGGPRNVRAYPVAERLNDTAVASTLEWLINAPGFADRPVGNRTWGEIFQLSFFLDYAWGEINEPLFGEEETEDFSGGGIGFQFNVPNKFYARFDVATPISDQEPSDDRDPQYFFRMSYTF